MEQRLQSTSGTLSMFICRSWWCGNAHAFQKPTWVQRRWFRIDGGRTGVAVVLPNFPKESVGLLEVLPQLAGVLVVAVKHPRQFPGERSGLLLLCVALHGARGIWFSCLSSNLSDGANLVAVDNWRHLNVRANSFHRWVNMRVLPKGTESPHSVFLGGGGSVKAVRHLPVDVGYRSWAASLAFPSLGAQGRVLARGASGTIKPSSLTKYNDCVFRHPVLATFQVAPDKLTAKVRGVVNYNGERMTGVLVASGGKLATGAKPLSRQSG